MKTLITDVVGMNHRVTPHTLHMLAEKAKDGPLKVSLRRDPKNAHDENAIEVILQSTPMKGMMLGFVPRQISARFAPMLDSGRAVVVDAHITEVFDDEGSSDLVVRWKSQASKPKTRKKKSP